MSTLTHREQLLERLLVKLAAGFRKTVPNTAAQIDALRTEIFAASPARLACVVRYVDAGGASILAALREIPEPAPRPAMADEKRVWTDARNAVLRRDWPAGRPLAEIHAEVAALPGKPLIGHSTVPQQANYLGLKRPDGYLTKSKFTPAADDLMRQDYPSCADTKDLLVRINGLLPVPVTNRHMCDRAKALRLRRLGQARGEGAEGCALPRQRPLKWNDAQRAYVAQAWPDGVFMADILARVAELGPPMSETQLFTLARRLGVQRPDGFKSLAARKYAASVCASVPVPFPAPAAKPPAERAWTEARIDSFRALADAGMTREQIAEEFVVSPNAISGIVRKLRCKGETVVLAAKARKAAQRSVWTEEKIGLLRTLKLQGLTRTEIAERLHVSVCAVIAATADLRARGVAIPDGRRNRANYAKPAPAVAVAREPRPVLAPVKFAHESTRGAPLAPPQAFTRGPVVPQQCNADADAQMIADFIRARGVTRCPAAYLEPSTAMIPAEDRAALQARREAAEAECAALSPSERNKWKRQRGRAMAHRNQAVRAQGSAP